MSKSDDWGSGETTVFLFAAVFAFLLRLYAIWWCWTHVAVVMYAFPTVNLWHLFALSIIPSVLVWRGDVDKKDRAFADVMAVIIVNLGVTGWIWWLFWMGT